MLRRMGAKKQVEALAERATFDSRSTPDAMDLCTAANNGDAQRVAELIAAGADCNMRSLVRARQTTAPDSHPPTRAAH